jgi:hypothetical protein
MLLFDERVLDGWTIPPEGIRDALVAGPLKSIATPRRIDDPPRPATM